MNRDASISPAGHINALFLADEGEVMQVLLDAARPDPDADRAVASLARRLLEGMRERQARTQGLHAFLQHYDLSSQEGIILMCLAEALLRIPDADTADRLIADKLTAANWKKHLGASRSTFVNASTWALMLTGRLLELGEEAQRDPGDVLARLVARLEEPVVRAALKSAMRIMASQFVMGRTIGEALERAAEKESRIYRYSYDMLGEAALTRRDADRYQARYADAIDAVGRLADSNLPLTGEPGVSVKLSALCPRFDMRHRERAVAELTERVLPLAQLARSHGIGMTIDAEEAERLELTLAVFTNVYRDKSLREWAGLGLAVQAYQKRATAVIDWLVEEARAVGRRIPVRLVKGAYWDTEIKRAQEQGLRDYPVFTRKCNTDVSYLACARRMLGAGEHIFPQFATHNAHTVAWIYRHAGKRDYEFQRLHGMGAELYEQVVGRDDGLGVPCRVYAPVGSHEDLLPYLVRRLLENGANTSFVNQVVRHDADPERVVADPVTQARAAGATRHPAIPLPLNLYGEARRNSTGVNFADSAEFGPLMAEVRAAAERPVEGAPLLRGEPQPGETVEVFDPASRGRRVGTVRFASEATARAALDTAAAAWPAWEGTPAAERAAILEQAADLYEAHRAELMALIIREGGRTAMDAHSEVREAVDFLRYYALQCRQHFAAPMPLPGPTGERNELRLAGRGVFACISPWNFPVAIFTGQIAAALAAGNTVIAKPAEQTSLCGYLATRLLHEAGVPPEVLTFLPGYGAALGRVLLADPRLAGVTFTGSTETARIINADIAARPGPIPVLIAETGGQNAMIADSSALAEQLVIDVVTSAFNSAGQRCSALRVLYLQDEIADRALEMLAGYMDELVFGDPMDLATDVGPVIDAEAKSMLDAHLQKLAGTTPSHGEGRGGGGKLLHQCSLPASCNEGTFFAPAVVEIDTIRRLDREVFGPVLHVVRYSARDLDQVIADINATGYGLTLGIHSRISDTAEYIRSRVRVGNIYVNRNMVGAVVGVQPFGGCGLSGTGPKAGGPHYLLRFATEQTCTINTAAVGGNASLLTLNQ